jgi:hypothetical protein
MCRFNLFSLNSAPSTLLANYAIFGNTSQLIDDFASCTQGHHCTEPQQLHCSLQNGYCQNTTTMQISPSLPLLSAVMKTSHAPDWYALRRAAFPWIVIWVLPFNRMLLWIRDGCLIVWQAYCCRPGNETPVVRSTANLAMEECSKSHAGIGYAGLSASMTTHCARMPLGSTEWRFPCLFWGREPLQTNILGFQKGSQL